MTRNTLLFAKHAKSVKNSAKVNTVTSDRALLEKYRREIERLKREIAQSSDVGSNAKVNLSGLDKELQVSCVCYT